MEVSKVKYSIEKILDDNKAQCITSIDLKNKSYIADYMIIASGTSSRHLQSLSEIIVSELKKLGLDSYDFIFIAIEKTPPFSVGVYRADQEMINYIPTEDDLSWDVNNYLDSLYNFENNFFRSSPIRQNRLRLKFLAKPASESPAKDFPEKGRPTG